VATENRAFDKGEKKNQIKGRKKKKERGGEGARKETNFFWRLADCSSPMLKTKFQCEQQKKSQTPFFFRAKISKREKCNCAFFFLFGGDPGASSFGKVSSISFC